MRALILLFSILGASSVYATIGPHMDVKLGLWETSIQAPMAGINTPSISPEDLAALPEAQRAQIQGMMAGHIGSTKRCIKPESLADNSAFNKKGCQQTLVSASSSVVVLKFQCTSKTDHSRGTITSERISSELMKGTIVSTTQEDGTPTESTLNFRSKWISPDCGSVE